MVLDVTNSLIQTIIPPKKYCEERVIIIITGVLVDMLVKLDSERYRKHVVFVIEYRIVYRTRVLYD